MIRKHIVRAAMLAALLAAGARAQDKPAGVAPADPPDDAAGQAAIKQFDGDGDGALTGDEITHARNFMRALRQAVADRRDGDNPPPAGDRPRPARPRAMADEVGPPPRDGEGRRGPEGRVGPGGRRPMRLGAEGDGPPPGDGERRRPRAADDDGDRPRPRPADDEGDHPRRRAAEDEGDRPAPPEGGEPGRLFERFDADGNGSLSRGEFRALMGELRPRLRDAGPPEGGPRMGPSTGDAPRRARPGGDDEGDRPAGPPEGRGAARRGGPRPLGPAPRAGGPRGDDGDRPRAGRPSGPPDDDQPQGPPRRGGRGRGGDGERRGPRGVGAERDDFAAAEPGDLPPGPTPEEQDFAPAL